MFSLEALIQQYPDLDPAACTRLIRAQIYITYTKQLSNLALQENRLKLHPHEKMQKAPSLWIR